MAAKHVMVEINLSSNDGIFNVKGQMHPLKTYMKAHVPVALSTDDEGVSRIDITTEYARAATEQGLSYGELEALGADGDGSIIFCRVRACGQRRTSSRR